MSGLFAITALAIAAERANAVGAVRLTCLPEGLEIELLRAAGFAEGFAPGSIAESVSFTVPYTAVRGLVRRGRTLCLALDPATVIPHNRFALVRFTDDPAEALAGTLRARLAVKWLGYLAPAPLGALAVYLAPSTLVGGALGALSLAVLVALAAWLILRELLRLLTWGGPVSDAYRDALEVELSRRLGLAPVRSAVTSAWDTPPPAETRAAARGDRAQGGALHGAGAPEDVAAAGRSTSRSPHGGAPPAPEAPGGPSAALVPRDRRRLHVWGAVAVATLGAVGVMAFLKRFAAPREIRPLSSSVAAGIGPSAQKLARIEARAPGDDRPRCLCRRADSPLWKDGVPTLSVLLSAQPDDGSGVVAPTIHEGRRPRYDFNLAVVNNSASPLHDVRVVLTFARRDEHDARVGITERGLFWGGALAPARAVKWRVRAPGTEVRVDSGVPGTLEESGAPAASPDAFYELLAARYRVVRIHGAMMLAYLRDPRAIEAVGALGASSAAEAETLARIRRAAAPLIACDIAVRDGLLEMCVFNGTSAPVRGAAAREVRGEGGEPPPARLIEGDLPVHEGVRISLPSNGDAVPQEITITP